MIEVRREGKKLWCQYKVRGYHIDVNGHVNNAEYLHFLEDARDDFLDYLGISISSLAEREVLLFLHEVRLQYVAPAFYGDELAIWGWLSELRRVKSTWRLDIHRAGSQELLTRAWIHVAFLNPGQRVISIPQDIRPILESVFLPDEPAR